MWWPGPWSLWALRVTGWTARAEFKREASERQHDNLRDFLDAAVEALSRTRNEVGSLRRVLDWPNQDLDFLTEVGTEPVDAHSPEAIAAKRLAINRYGDHEDSAWEKVNKGFPRTSRRARL